MVASCPSESGLHCPVAFENGSCVAEGTVGFESASEGQLVEPLFHDVVVILAIGIGGNLVLVIINALGRGVVYGEAHD